MSHLRVDGGGLEERVAGDVHILNVLSEDHASHRFTYREFQDSAAIVCQVCSHALRPSTL